MAVKLNQHDLQFILDQIKIAEAHAAGTPLSDLVDSALLPYGLRTVDGSYNNLVPGRENWAASDQPFLQITNPSFRNEQDDSISFGNGAVTLDNNDYASSGNPPPGSMGLGGGTVVDADPRLISNLIVDQTSNNPVATQLYERYLSEGLNVSATPLFEKDGVTPVLASDGSQLISYQFDNVSPDIGDSAPYNSLFTLFGQFFDHGLDMVGKGGNGTVYMPLQPDDPLYVEGSHANFMALTRATIGEGAKNTTTPWVDQNQTYGSHASHQVFLREYTTGPDGRPVATGHLLEGAQHGMSTWGDLKAQAAEVLGIQLTDLDVGSGPVLATDEYGNFIPGPNGFPQLVVIQSDGNGGFTTTLVEGDPSNPVDPSGIGAARTGHAFLADIAHSAVPVVAGGVLVQDADDIGGNVVANVRGNNTEYDNELLDAHFIAGDGRANENFGLTAIHHIFHSEHNRLVEHAKDVVLAHGDLEFLNEWLLDPVSEFPTAAADIAALSWNGERLFQAGRFTNEMEYQHLVFEEFARKMQPDVDAFVFEPDPDINPAIFAEFAHVVYRFGHSMLNETVDRINADGSRADVTLFDAFLNPLGYDGNGTVSHDVAAGAIIRGMSAQVGNEIDEFVTNVLRNQLTGIPLDLAAINIARGRDTGMPTLNEARAQFKAIAGGDTQLDPYTGWTDFAVNLKNPESIVNFIAAYGTHELITGETSIAGKRAAAMALVFGTEQTFVDGIDGATKTIAPPATADRLAFLGGSGAYADDLGGLNGVDLWMGGLAEKKMAFGGMLGSTFSFIFELQLENLQDGDRFYYLSRVQGLNLLTELENNSLTKMALANTDLEETGSAVPADFFATPNVTLYLDHAKQMAMTGEDDPVHDNPTLEAISNMVERRDANNDGIAEYLRYNGGAHVLIQGTDGNDHIIAGDGDDAIWGGKGDDRLEGGYGVDHVHGGEGDDIITNSGTDIGEMDFLHGDEGNDAIHGGSGLALIFGNGGKDFIITGPDGKEVFAGEGDDFVRGGDGGDFLLGGEGDDWMEGGDRFDTFAGENSELFFNSTIIGHDVLNGNGGDTDYDAESGDDIMFQGVGIQRNNGMAGFDWAIHKGDSLAANSDLGIPIFVNQEEFILRDRFDLVEGLSGWKHDDILRGRSGAPGARDEQVGGAAIPAPNDPFLSWSNALTAGGVARIDGFDEIVAHINYDASAEENVVMETGNGSDILLGGGGSDLITGEAGDDIIDGDRWLNVRISIRNAAGIEIATADGMTGKMYTSAEALAAGDETALFAGGKTLQEAVFDRTINPGQLFIVREMVSGNVQGDRDTAAYTDMRGNYTFNLSADGSLVVDHTGFSDDGAVDDDDDIEAGEGEGVANALSDGRDTLRNIETLRFTDGEINVITGTPGNDAGSSRLDGTDGQDILIGLAGNDVLNGGGGEDMLFGNQDNDLLSGGAGNDWIHGGQGNDTLVGGAGNDTVTGGVGTDTAVFGGAVGNYSFALSGSSIVVTALSGTDGTDTLTTIEDLSFGGSTLTLRQGTTASQTLDGATNVADLMLGFGGNDILNGLSGNDVLVGEAGNDILNGGSGRDRLISGAGTDTFVFNAVGDAGLGTNATTGRDLITDFVRGQDRINLSAIDATSAFGNGTFTWRGTAALDTATDDGGLRYFTQNGNTIIQGSNDNDTTIEFEIELAGIYALTASDFIL